MIQLIFMVIGVVYLFKLIGMNSKTGAELGLDSETLVQWQGHRRRKYGWMIAAGWGSFVVGIAAAVLFGSIFGGIGGQIAGFIVSLVAMGWGWSMSSKSDKLAKDLEMANNSRAAVTSQTGSI